MSRTKIGETKWFFCRECRDRIEVFCKMEGVTPTLFCKKCGNEREPLDKQAQMYWKPFTPYYHHQLGEHFSSRSEERDFVKKNGLVNISGDFGRGKMSERKSPREFCQDRYLDKRRKMLK